MSGGLLDGLLQGKVRERLERHRGGVQGEELILRNYLRELRFLDYGVSGRRLAEKAALFEERKVMRNTGMFDYLYNLSSF